MYQGVVVVNKEPGFTSFDVVAICRKIFGQKAVGHTGTLDPMARGVLPVCLGRATKLSSFLLSTEKQYAVEMELGITTDTDDSTGKEMARAESDQLSQITEDAVRAALYRYLGEYLQIPPRYAAIKKDGKKLYEYARAGIEVDIPGRPVTIYELNIRDISLPKVTFDVRCSKGTYIRSLCRDVGKDLGVGAVMTGLIRESTSGFTVDDALTLDQLKELKENDRLEEAVHPMDVLLSEYPALQILPDGEKRLLNGNALEQEDVAPIASADPRTQHDISDKFISDKLQDENQSEKSEGSEGQTYRIYYRGMLYALYCRDEARGGYRCVKMLAERTE